MSAVALWRCGVALWRCGVPAGRCNAVECSRDALLSSLCEGAVALWRCGAVDSPLSAVALYCPLSAVALGLAR